MIELWYKKLGFYSNPFSIKPAAFNNELVAYDLDYIYEKISNGEVLFIEGRYGTGKTTILKNIISNFRGKNKIIYYSFNAEKRFDLKKLLDGANTFIRKIAGMKVKDVILLLDEVHTMTKKDASQILHFYKNGSIRSVVFVTHDSELVNFPEEIESLLDGNVIRTIDLNSKEAVSLVRRRIGDIDILSDTIIVRLFNLAEKNPRRMLAFCEDVSRYAVEMGDTKVTEFHIKEVLGDLIKEKTAKKPKAVKEEKEEIVQEKKDKEVKKEKQKKPRAPAKKKSNAPLFEEIDKVPLMEELEASKAEVIISEEMDADGPKIEITEIPPAKVKERKFKVNRLVDSSSKDKLGTIAAKEEEDNLKEEEIPEYSFYYREG